MASLMWLAVGVGHGLGAQLGLTPESLGVLLYSPRLRGVELPYRWWPCSKRKELEAAGSPKIEIRESQVSLLLHRIGQSSLRACPGEMSSIS